MNASEYYDDWKFVKSAIPHVSLTPKTMYNLADPKVLDVQDDLANRFGVGGFIFYHYWRNNEVQLDLPVDLFSQSPRKTKFMLCWDNHAMTDFGTQLYDKPEVHAYRLLRFFLNRNHLRNNEGEIPFMIYEYRSTELELYMRRFENFLFLHGVKIQVIFALRFEDDLIPTWSNRAAEFAPNLHGRAYLYKRSKELKAKTSKLRDYWQGMLVGWDSRPRQLSPMSAYRDFYRRNKGLKRDGLVQPNRFANLLKAVRAHISPNNKEKIITLFAWNEWSEGAALEPSKEWNLKFLEALGTKKHFC
jgi:hypothetical protein